MVCITVCLAHQVKGFQVWFTTVVNKTTLVAVLSCIETEWEEILERVLLYLHVILILSIGIIHVKQKTETLLVIQTTSLITFLCCEYLTYVFNYIGTLWYRLQSKESPHRDLFQVSKVHCLLAYPFYQYLPLVLVF